MTARRRRAMMWAAGAILLLALNFRRDLARTLATYEWQPVTAGTLHRVVSSAGVMEAATIATVKSEVDEAVEKIFVGEGRAVKKGDIIMELTRTRSQLEFQQRRNALAEADADVKKTSREYALQEKLFRDQAVSRFQVEDALRARDKTAANREIVAREFDLAKKKLDSTTVRAPIDGVVLKLFVNEGQFIGNGKEIVTVGDISRFAVRAKIDELDIQQVKVGQSAAIRADAFPEQVLTGRVRTIATQAERENFAKIEVIIDVVDSKGLALKHNLSVRSEIRTEDIPNALGVSIRAIQKKDGDTAWVLVRRTLGVISRRKITVGRPAGDLVEVTGGLSPGDRVGVPLMVGNEP